MSNGQALLALEDGSLFYGESIGISGETIGEVVFNTAITGYQEILTDPSYLRQIMVFTVPHVGNVGVNEEDLESDRIQVAMTGGDAPALSSYVRTRHQVVPNLVCQGLLSINS